MDAWDKICTPVMPSRLALWLITGIDLPLPYLNQQSGYLKFSKLRLFFFYFFPSF
jgi:hypothetical protein